MPSGAGATVTVGSGGTSHSCATALVALKKQQYAPRSAAQAFDFNLTRHHRFVVIDIRPKYCLSQT
jgi:hypothetical protein